jgi:exopolysaccharide biosynthesis operon protein EpsL
MTVKPDNTLELRRKRLAALPGWAVCARSLGVGAMLASMTLTGPAHATEGDTLTLSAGVSQMHDDNLFRLPDNADTQSLLGHSTRSDDITVTSLSLKFDKLYSLQRFQLELGLSDHRYRTFTNLDYTAKDYVAAWHWRVTPSFYGTLSSERLESLNSYADYSDYGTRNLRTDEEHRFDGVLEVGGPWRLLAGVAQATRTNSELFSQERDSRLRSSEAGVRYDFRSGTQLSLIGRRGHGEYFNQDEPIEATQSDTRFDQRETEVRLNWPLTAHTTLDMRAAHLERTHPHFGERDYSGQVGGIDMHWTPTEKTSLTASLGRELSSYQATSSSYIRTERLSLVPIWQISAKTALRGKFGYARRHYLGAIEDSALAGRFDTQRSALIAVDWRPWRSLALSASLQNDRRSSNQSGNDYKSTMAGISAHYAF